MASIALRSAFCDLMKDPLATYAIKNHTLKGFEPEIKPLETVDLTFEQAVENLKRPLEERVVCVISADNLQKADGDTGTFLIDQCILFKGFPTQNVQQNIDYWTARKNVSILTAVVSGILLASSFAGVILATNPVIAAAAAVSFAFTCAAFGISAGSLIVSRQAAAKYYESLQMNENVPLSQSIAKNRSEFFNAYLDGHKLDAETLPLFAQCVRESERKPLITAAVTKALQGKTASSEAIQAAIDKRLSNLNFLISVNQANTAFAKLIKVMSSYKPS